MRYSSLLIPTLKETPADAEVASHRLLLRAGFIRQLGAGIYAYLPLFRLVVSKIESIIREEMHRIGGQEFHLPALLPKELWDESGRWETMGLNMFRLKDRRGADLCLGMTHEEIFTALARSELRSYRELPQIWYQIQTKFRDEPRPKSGILRVRQFTMKDSYSFDRDNSGLDRSFLAHEGAYDRIFHRCGLKFMAVEAHSGAMGGSKSTEFMVKTNAGEDNVASCAGCGYAANTERAESRLTPIADEGEEVTPQAFATPGVATIQDLEGAPYGVPGSRQIKTLVYVVAGKPTIVLLRGCDELVEAKLERACASADLRPARPEEIPQWMGARPGSLGPVGKDRGSPFEGRVLADLALQGRKNLVTGANRDGYHLQGVTPDRDFHPQWTDLRAVRAGEGCPRCEGTLDVCKALEIGHIFKLGTRYSESMGARILDEHGSEVPIVMGSYGIGVERIAAAAVELHHDEHGICWPITIAPYQVVLLALQPRDKAVLDAATRLYEELLAAGVDVLFDDRDERPGVKFHDADLVGIPVRIAVGKQRLAKGEVEIKLRKACDTQTVAVGEAVKTIRGVIAELMAACEQGR